jgi:hypothetical protein
MTEDIPATIVDSFEGHDGYRRTDGSFAVETTAFEGTVTATAGEPRASYTVTVRVPTLDAVTADEVGEAVVSGWLDTLERRLEDAPKATRAVVDLEDFEVERVGDEVRVEYSFAYGDADKAADIAKTFVEYVEGTYVEGVIPGYEYESPVDDLLTSASQSDDYGPPL